MKLLISHMSALRYWRSANEWEVARSKRRTCRMRSFGGCVTSVKDVRRLAPDALGVIMSTQCPLDILVPDRQLRRQTKELTPHVWSTSVPHGAMRKLDDEGIYISTPEFVYLQLATSLDEVDLARLGNELCGTYTLRYGGFDERRPLTTKFRLSEFVQRAPDAYAAAKARECLRWIADGSASPKETNTLLAMCLPRRLGGHTLPLPQLNKELHVRKRLALYVNNGVYRPDFMWEVRRDGVLIRVTAEYDSAQEHNYGMKAEYTRIRRNDFKTMGYLTNSINNSQLKSAEAFEIAVRQIARDLGRRHPRADMVRLGKQQALLDRLWEDMPL